MHPVLEVEPCDYIVPVLHLLIGLVNKIWTTLLHFLDEFVENVSEYEANLKDKLSECNEKIVYISEEIVILTANKHIACEEYNDTPTDDLRDSIIWYTKEIKQNQTMKTKLNKDLRKLKNDLVTEREKRCGNENAIDHLLYNVLEGCNIKKQHFHGGSMNGVCCRRLLDNLDVIFPAIENVVLERLNRDVIPKTDKQRDNITLVLERFYKIFETMDVVFFDYVSYHQHLKRLNVQGKQ